jgi:hypothetical protein
MIVVQSIAGFLPARRGDPMHVDRRVFALLLIPLMQACSQQAAPATSTATAPESVKPGVAAPSKAQVTACQLVTAAEMSMILNSPVVATPDDGSAGSTRCTYKTDKPITHTTPYVELSVDWGSGAGAMSATSALNQHEPGIADPYAGIGDQAMAMGPTLMIRTGEDLMTIVQSGVDDVPGTARKIFDTAKPRM